MSDPARISFTRPVWAALAVLGLLLVALLATQIVLLEDQRTTVDRQLAVAVEQAQAVEPAADETRAFVREAGPLVHDAKAALPASTALAKAATPLVDDLANARMPEQLQAAGALARSLLNADVAQATRTLARTDLRGLADDVGSIATELLTQDRLRRTLIRTSSVLGEVQALHTIPKATTAAETVPRIERILTQSLEVQRETLIQAQQIHGLTTELRDIGLQTRGLTRTAARSAESLDRKTGPSLAQTAGG